MLALFVVLAVLFILSILYLNYMGVLTPIEIKSKRVARSLLLYCEYVGHYKNIGSVFENLGKNVKPLFKPNDQLCGIYYDDPNTLEDRSRSRAVCGILIEEDERANAEKFISKNPIFKVKDLPEADCLYTFFPYKSKMSMLFFVIRVYPEVKKYAFSNRIVKRQDDVKGSMEIYHYELTPKQIELNYLYGEEANAYQLSTQPAPAFRQLDDNNKLK